MDRMNKIDRSRIDPVHPVNPVKKGPQIKHGYDTDGASVRLIVSSVANLDCLPSSERNGVFVSLGRLSHSRSHDRRETQAFARDAELS